MGKPDQISSIFWLSFGLAVIYGSNRLGLGTLTHPGPGFLPFWSGVILCGLSALVFFQDTLPHRGRGGETLGHVWAGLNWPKPIYLMIALLAYTLIFTHLGFLLSTTVLLLFLFKAVEPETWLRTIVGAILASVITYIVFGVWLQVQLPRGFLEGFFS